MTPAATPPASPEARVSRTPEPVRVAPPKPTLRATPSPRSSARLRIELEHSLKNGVLRAWVDDELTFTEKLDSRVAQKIVLDSDRPGAGKKTLRLKPGTHTVRLEVHSGKKTHSARTEAVFVARSLRRLAAKLSQGRLTLRWK
jgi:hypothetical protein